MRARLEWRVNNGDWQEDVVDLGGVPVMLRSNRCQLEGMSPAALVKAKEESDELGGYFIVNGIEKIIRLLQVNRRNYPMAIKRGKPTPCTTSATAMSTSVFPGASPNTWSPSSW